MISARSNSARPPKTVSISRPCAVVVSAQASASDLKPAPGFRNRVEDVEQVARGSGEPVKPRHHQHITLVQPSQQFRKLGPVSTGTADLLRPRRDRALSGSDAVEKLSN
jgi:hypothetical protein